MSKTMLGADYMHEAKNVSSVLGRESGVKVVEPVRMERQLNFHRLITLSRWMSGWSRWLVVM